MALDRNSSLEDRAKEMAEYYWSRRSEGKMTDRDITVCVTRVKQEHPKLHAELVKCLRELNKSKPK